MVRILLVIVASTVILSCNNSVKTQKDNSEPLFRMDFIKVFEGKIENQFEYYAKLKSNSGKITGSYFYKEKCEKILIEGSLDSMGNIILNEWGKKGNKTGVFKGRMVNQHKFEGSWSKDHNSKKYSFYFIETTESFDDAILSCERFRKSKVLTNLVLDQVELLAFPATKHSGKAWDNALASYKPDLFLSISDFNKKIIYNHPSYFNNQTNNDLPLIFNFSEKIKLSRDQYIDGIILSFYDYDSATNNDLVGFIAFDTFKEHYETKSTIQIFEAKGTKIKLTFHYE